MRKTESKYNSSDKDFEAFFKAYYRLALYVSVKITNNPIVSEDIVQDVFYQIWANAVVGFFDKPLKNYLLRSVRNRSINYLRDKKNTIDVFEMSSDITDSEYDFSREEKAVQIWTEIEKLPPKCKEIFKLVVLDEMKYKEAGESLHVSINTIKTQMGIAYKQLRKINPLKF